MIVQIFSRQKIFGEVIAKISELQISVLLEGKGFIFESWLHRKLENAEGFARIDGKPFSCAAAVRYPANFFPPVLMKKKRKFFETLRNRFDIPHCPLRFVTLTITFYERSCRIRLLFA